LIEDHYVDGPRALTEKPKTVANIPTPIPDFVIANFSDFLKFSGASWELADDLPDPTITLRITLECSHSGCTNARQTSETRALIAKNFRSRSTEHL